MFNCFGILRADATNLAEVDLNAYRSGHLPKICCPEAS